MRISAVSIKLFEKDKLKAFATITVDDALVIRGIKIIEGKKGLFVAMPNRRRPDFTFQDIAHPVTVEARQELERIVLEAYGRALAASGDGGRGGPSGNGGPTGDGRGLFGDRLAAGFDDDDLDVQVDGDGDDPEP